MKKRNKQRIRVNVTQEDINQGLKNGIDTDQCPIALALKRTSVDMNKLALCQGNGEIYLENDNTGVIKARLPYVTELFVFTAQKKGPVKPFKFEFYW